MTRLVGVDPGAPHVGTSIWELHDRWICVRAREVDPDRFVDSLYRLLSAGEIQRVAYEQFWLGGSSAAVLAADSTLRTIEVIGAARHIARWHGIELEPVGRDMRKSALTRMRAVKWQFPRGAPDHVRDAIAVGACATDWRASAHIAGDGVTTPNG